METHIKCVKKRRGDFNEVKESHIWTESPLIASNVHNSFVTNA